MPVIVATWLVRLGGAYLLSGLLFAVPFAARWAGRLDPVAGAGTRGFRLLILPGAVALWPVLALRLLKGEAAPPLERSRHIRASRRAPR